MFKIYNRDTRKIEHFDSYEDFYNRYFELLKYKYIERDVIILRTGLMCIMSMEEM